MTQVSERVGRGRCACVAVDVRKIFMNGGKLRAFQTLVTLCFKTECN